MPNYKVPGVYMEKVESGSKPIDGVATSVVAFMGKAPRIMNEFTAISSWSDFVQKATFGSDKTVFDKNDFMAYNIYNFYQNGGGKAYFGVITTDDAKKAVIKQGTISFEAKYAGDWANGLLIQITANATDATKFDLVIGRATDTAGTIGTVYEQYTKLSNNEADGRAYYLNALLGSDLVVVTNTGDVGLAVTASALALTGGADIEDYEDTDLVGINGLIHKLDTISDCAMIINGGQTSDTVLAGILEYCTNRGDMYALLDAPDTTLVNTVITARNKLNGLGEIHYPYVKMADPVTGNTIEVPASGMVAGTYARFDASYGCWRAAAGAEAQLRGAIGTAKVLTDLEFEQLFAAGVNCIISKPNAGVLMYGARSLGQTYVSDDRLDIYVTQSIKKGTEWALFELNDDKLWLRLRTALLSFLEGLFLKGAFKGDGENSAYYAVCDASINTDANIEKGIVTTEYGYAKKKPAEFVVHRFSQMTASAANN